MVVGAGRGCAARPIGEPSQERLGVSSPRRLHTHGHDTPLPSLVIFLRFDFYPFPSFLLLPSASPLPPHSTRLPTLSLFFNTDFNSPSSSSSLLSNLFLLQPDIFLYLLFSSHPLPSTRPLLPLVLLLRLLLFSSSHTGNECLTFKKCDNTSNTSAAADTATANTSTTTTTTNAY